jgi:hypothetical protein
VLPLLKPRAYSMGRTRRPWWITCSSKKSLPRLSRRKIDTLGDNRIAFAARPRRWDVHSPREARRTFHVSLHRCKDGK